MRDALDTRIPRLLETNRRWRDSARHALNGSSELGVLQRWQAERLRRSFADFLATSDTRAAAEFFLSDLYGDHDVSARDQGVAKVMPLMQRLLPEAFLHTAADGIELAALSHALDLRVTKAWIDQGAVSMDAAQYSAAYRWAGLPRLRRRQLDLIHVIGEALGQAVHKPVLGRMLRASRLPARLAGLADLQQFLERGFAAFAQIRDVSGFLQRIEAREREVSRRLFAGHAAPFDVE